MRLRRRLRERLGGRAGRAPGQGHEGDGQDGLGVNDTVGALLHHQKFLAAVGLAHGEDQAGPRSELLHQGRRYPRGRGGDQDAVEGGLLGPAEVAVPESGLDVCVAQVRQAPRGGLGQIGMISTDRPGPRPATGPPPDSRCRCRPPRPGLGPAVQQVRHQGDDVGLGDGLAPTDGQGAVRIGVILALAGTKDSRGPRPWRP